MPILLSAFLFCLPLLGCNQEKVPIKEHVSQKTSGEKAQTETPPSNLKERDLAPAFSKPLQLNAPPQAILSPTGLARVTLKKNEDDTHLRPNVDSVITVRFKGWTSTGELFQESKEESPFTQRVGNLLKGWQEGVMGMNKGEIHRFWMPGKLAYDNDPNPNSQKGNLIFDIELIEFKNRK